MDMPDGSAASGKTWLSWKKQDLELHHQHHLVRRPSLLWSPQGTFLWVDTSERGYIMAAQQGQQILEVDTISTKRQLHWAAAGHVYLMSSNLKFENYWGNLAGYHPSMSQDNLDRLQRELLPSDRRWLSLCGRLLVTLNAPEEDDGAMTLSHWVEGRSHEVQTPWAGNPSISGPFSGRTYASLDWLPMPQDLLIYALAVLGFVVLVDAHSHVVISCLVHLASLPVKWTAGYSPLHAVHTIDLRWSPDGQALFVQALAPIGSGHCHSLVLDFSKRMAT